MSDKSRSDVARIRFLGIAPVLRRLAASSMREDYLRLYSLCEWTRGEELADLNSVFRVKEDAVSVASACTQVLEKISDDAEYFWVNDLGGAVLQLCTQGLNFVDRLLCASPDLPLSAAWELYSQVEFIVEEGGKLFQNDAFLGDMKLRIHVISMLLENRAIDRNCWSWARRCARQDALYVDFVDGELSRKRQLVNLEWERIAANRLCHLLNYEDALLAMRWISEFDGNDFVQTEVVQINFAQLLNFLAEYRREGLGDLSRWLFNHGKYEMMMEVEARIAS